MCKDHKPDEVDIAFNEVIVGNLKNHVKFWVVIALVLSSVVYLVDFVAKVPAYVDSFLGN